MSEPNIGEIPPVADRFPTLAGDPRLVLLEQLEADNDDLLGELPAGAGVSPAGHQALMFEALKELVIGDDQSKVLDFDIAMQRALSRVLAMAIKDIEARKQKGRLVVAGADDMPRAFPPQ